MLELDRIAQDVRAWRDELLSSGPGPSAFVWGDEPGPNLLHLNDLVWIQYVTGDLGSKGAAPATSGEGADWAEAINAWQDPDGRFHYPEWERHGWEHATWQSVGALTMLGSQPGRALDFLRKLKTPSAIREWVADFNWQTTHHRFMLLPLLASSGVSGGWIRACFVQLQTHQDAATGFWPDAETAHRLSPTFLMTVLHHLLAEGPPRRERIIDTTLAFQRDDGLFSAEGRLGYADMDAAYLLWSIASRTGYRLEECLAAVEHLARRMDADYLREGMPILQRDPHVVLAACGACAVVQAFAPHSLTSSRRWRFPWSEGRLFRVPS